MDSANARLFSTLGRLATHPPIWERIAKGSYEAEPSSYHSLDLFTSE